MAALLPPLAAAATDSRSPTVAGHGAAPHAPLKVSSDSTLADVVDVAVERSPEQWVLAAIQSNSAAWGQRGRSPIAGQPAFSLRYQTDALGEDRGLAEWEGGLAVPLWRIGERRAAGRFARSLSGEGRSTARSMRWRLAGRVREIIWELALTENGVERAEAELEIAERMLVSVTRRHQLGDVSARDRLLAQSSKLQAHTALLGAEAKHHDALRAYRSLTGLAFRPVFAAETLADRAEITAEHPALEQREAELRRLRSRLTVSRQAAKGSPVLLIGPRRERSVRDQEFEDSVGITLSMPVGTSNYARTVSADAELALARGEAARDLAQRQLLVNLHEAEHELSVIEASLGDAGEILEIAQQHYRMAKTAYSENEIEFRELLRSQATHNSAASSLSRLQLERSRQIARFNQAVGVLP